MFFLLNRILLEKAGNEDGISEIRSNLNDRAIHKSRHTQQYRLSNLKPFFGGGVGMQLDHRPVATYERVFHMQLCALR